MTSELRDDLNDLLKKLPAEINLDLAGAASRFSSEPSLKKKVEGLVEAHPSRERILGELFGTGPLAPLLEDETITEIIVNGFSSIYFERDGAFYKHDDHFLSAFTLSQFIQFLCSEAKIRLDLNHPFADGFWRGLRVHIAQAPLVSASHTLCLRRHPKKSWRLSDFAERGWAEASQIDKLQSLLRDRTNLLIVGPTGSGKTSLISALLSEIPQTERAVVIEDTPEIHLPNAISTKLLTRADNQGILKDFSQTDLVKQSLRMRPERLVIGEVRGGEARDLLLALSTGHTGSLGSLHANSAKQALLRLEMLIQMGAPAWSQETIRQLILLGLGALVVVEIKDGKRKLEGIYKICSLEKIGFLLEKI
jgi:pilus assembly protein CpaF